MCSFATGLYRSFCRSQPFLQVIYVPCNNYLDKSSKFKCHILLLRGFSTDLWPLSIRQTKFKGLQDIPEALLALPLYYFLFLCLPVHKSTFMHTCTLPCKLTLVYWHVTLCDGNHSRSTASQRLELLRNKKEHNAPKLDKAQCSFCCYSETRPSLSPTHICKIINRCLKSFLRPAYHKHSLPHYIIPFSQSPCLAPFLCISSIPSQLLTCWCTQASNTCKYSQRKTLSLPTHTHTHAHLCAQAYPIPTKPWSPETHTALMFCVFCLSSVCFLVGALFPHYTMKLSPHPMMSLCHFYLIYQIFYFWGST